MYDRDRVLIIDGFNVLRSGSRYKRIAAPTPDYDSDSFNRARDTLINDVVNFAGHEWEATIVFDGGGNELSEGEAQMIGGVRVVFSPAGTTADYIIEKLSHQAREHEREVMVVTSDASIQDTVFGFGVDRMSAEGFSREVTRYYEEAHLDQIPKVVEKRTIAERIDADTLEKLKSLRDNPEN